MNPYDLTTTPTRWVLPNYPGDYNGNHIVVLPIPERYHQPEFWSTSTWVLVAPIILCSSSSRLLVVLWFLLFHLSNIMDQIPVLHDDHYSMKRQPLLDPQQPTLTNILLTNLLTRVFLAGRPRCLELF